MKKLLLFIVLLCIFLSFEVFAAPTLSGPTGLITLPNADVVDYQDFNIGLNLSLQKEEGLFGFSGNISPINNLELGISKAFHSSDMPLFFNGKYKLWNFKQQKPFSLAIGAQFGFAKENQNNIYVITTHSTPYPFIPSIGLQIASYKGKTYLGLPMGAEWILTEEFRILPEITLAQFPVFGLGGRLAVNKTTRLDVFLISFDYQSRIGFQLSFNSNPKTWH